MSAGSLTRPVPPFPPLNSGRPMEAGTSIEFISEKAMDLGFIAVGFSAPDTPPYLDRFKSWLLDRKFGDMSWLERNLHLREDPSRLLEGCRVVISLAFPYSFLKPATPDGFTISRYAQPDREDYHNRLRRRCRELARLIRERHEGCLTRICVDSAPILERSYACASGIGFIGKNNMLIIPGYGSYFYLAEILTTAPLTFSPASPLADLCGSCTRCLEACPSGALERPYYLDASRCLSYLTIEHRDPPGEETAEKMGTCFMGCDRCQEACPFNTSVVGLKVSLPSTETFLEMDLETFDTKFGNTALARAGIEKLKANIRAIGT